MQYAPFRHVKWPISWAEMHHITFWYRFNRTSKWAILENKTNGSGLWYRVYEKIIQAEMASEVSNLTFLYTYFSNLFCQKIVKKNCKFVAWVFIKDADIRKEYGHEMYVFLLLWWIIVFYNMILSLISKYAVAVYTCTHCQKNSRHFISYFMNKDNYTRIPTEP